MNRKGFNLVELMIVVAIIGIIAAIALPNFISFQRKARQSEAKSMLSSYFTSLKAHAGEIGCFRGNFVSVGFIPEGELYYRIKTAHNGACALSTQHSQVDDSLCVSTGEACNAFSGYTKNWVEKLGNVYDVGTAVMNRADFIAIAGSNIGGANSDVWTINENKTLANVSSGL